MVSARSTRPVKQPILGAGSLSRGRPSASLAGARVLTEFTCGDGRPTLPERHPNLPGETVWLLLRGTLKSGRAPTR